VDSARLGDRGFRYEDLVRAADVVVTKPGYGIVSECIANDTAILYTTRGRFPEFDVLVEGMRRYARSAFIAQDALLKGEWRPSLDRLLAEPAPHERPRTDGAEVVAAMILKELGGVGEGRE
jgi:L-arabinokinase